MISKSLADMRISYDLGTLGENEVLQDPVEQFAIWFEEVSATSVIEANAMVLATVGQDGVPQARTILIKGFDRDGLVFYTNYHSAKASAIFANPNVCALFYWPSLQRQVRWTGIASRTSEKESDAYFATRPRGSQLGAWASNQSHPLAGPQELSARFTEVEHEFEDSEDVPRPEHWGGFRIRPVSIEFWQGRQNRLHDRILYTAGEGGNWSITRLAP